MLLKGQGVSLSGSQRSAASRSLYIIHLTLYSSSSSSTAERRRPIKAERRTDFTALNIVTGVACVPFIVQPARGVMTGYVIAGM